MSSDTFVFTPDTANGLRAVSWKNRLTGQVLELGDNPEISFDIGLPDQPLLTPQLKVVDVSEKVTTTGNEAAFLLESPDVAASVKVVYRWNDKEPVLHKYVTITNTGDKPWDRLLNVRLGEYDTGDAVLSGGELQVYPASFRERAHRIGGLQGFPVYVNDQFFLSLAHPAGWATQKPGHVNLRHYPGTVLQPGQSRDCMEAVYGVASPGQGRVAFLAHLKSRMRRMVRDHDRPYAIFEPFGGQPQRSADDNPQTVGAAFPSGDKLDEFDENEPYLLDMIEKVKEGQCQAEGQFDFFSVDFWVDNKGDIKQANPIRFPNQFDVIKTALDKVGIKMGLWIDSTFCGWSVGGNPTTKPAIVQEVGLDFFEGDAWEQWATQAYFCRATEPVRTMYTEGFLHHIRENGVRLLKFDNFNSQCSNPAHDHLSGIYGNEATHDAVIECYQAFDQACPDVFMMLYWGYRSPWWLLYADTIFETGVEMEASSPGNISALYARDGVTRKLDQGRSYAKDVPSLGLDSLGVWLSNWDFWNSGIGTERWQEGFVMDICRGHALAQPWTDSNWLTPAEHLQIGEFIDLMKAQPECFINSRLILGNPWKTEPYGYSCSDGKRAFLAINNGTWQDWTSKLQLNEKWGLSNNKSWDIYRWYPNPAKLTGPEKGFGHEAQMAMRPFEVVLLEVVPHGDTPSLARLFAEKAIPKCFTEPSRAVEVTAEKTVTSPDVWTITGEILGGQNGGILAIVMDLIKDDTPYEMGNIGSFLTAEATVAETPTLAQPAIGTDTYPSSWQTWRINVMPSSTRQSFSLRITDLPEKKTWMNKGKNISEAQRRFSAYFLPQSD